MPRSGKRGWPGPRPRRATLGHDSARQTLRPYFVGARIARPMASPVLEVATIFFRMLTINVRAQFCTRSERRLHGNNRRGPHIASTPAPGVRRKTKLPRRYRKSNFSTVCGQICLRSRASANIPGGGDSQEGVKTPSCARGGRAGREYAVRNSSVANPRQRNHRTFYAKNPFACPASATAHANPAQNARSAVRY